MILPALVLLASGWPAARPWPASAAGGQRETTPKRVPADQRQAIASVNVPILMYHYLTEETTPPTVYHVTGQLFERQMAALAAYGYQTVSLQDYLAYRAGTAAPPERPVIVTFDDAHRSVYTIARPVMNSLGQNLTFFVTTNYVTDDGRWGSLTWSELGHFLAEGHHVESHSLNHPDLTTIPGDEAWQEIQGSRLEIEGRLASQVRFFSYPYGAGAEDPALQGMVQDAGYQAAVAARPHRQANTADSDIWALPRLAIGQEHGVDLEPGREAYFFMRQIDPGFPLPDITIDGWRVLGQGATAGHCYDTGDDVTIEVDITNSGEPMMVQVILNLDEDEDHDQVIFSETAAAYVGRGESATVAYQLPLDQEPGYGSLRLAIRVMDQHGLLGYGQSGWHAAILLPEECPTVRLPVVRR